jgi:succinate dehydrogenase/fumarate reductase cytochrome b subunit
MEKVKRPDLDFLLARSQAVTGLLFLLFMALHLTNQILAAYSVGAYNAYQRAMQPVYQFPLLEIGLVMGPLILHIAIALARMRLRRGRPRRVEWRAQLHRYSGLYLLLVIFGHIAATRGPSFFAGIYPGFEGVSFSLWFAPYFFYPYYVLFVLAALYHGANGTYTALRILGVRVPLVLRTGWLFWTPIALGAAFAVVGILGQGGWLYPISNPADNDYGRLLMRILGALGGG